MTLSSTADWDILSTKERIIAAGEQAILAKSYNGVGLKEILNIAGVPKGSFYHYFKSKEDFAIKLIEHVTERMLEKSKATLFNEDEPSPRKRLENFFAQAREFYVDASLIPECLITRLAFEMSHVNEPMRLAIKTSWLGWATVFILPIIEAQSKGEISKIVNAEDAANFIVDAWEGVTQRMQVERDIAAFDRFTRMVFTVLLPPA